MPQPNFYQTYSGIGIDPTVYYAVSASATPETPAPPFQVGTQAHGTDGSQFVFVQASTTINPGDFVTLNIGQNVSPFQANSVTTTNVQSSLCVGLAATGLVVAQSVSYIPAGAYFWAVTKGQYIPALSSAGLATNTGGVMLFTTATAGVISSVTTSQSLNIRLQGMVCVNSLTVSIPNSIVPFAGTGSNGYTVGPVVNINNLRAVVVPAEVSLNGPTLQVYTF